MIFFILLFIILIITFLFYASYCIRSNIYVKTISKKKTKSKILALSFDDGPHPIQTPAVLKVLKEYDAKACFFCIGENIEGNEKIIEKILLDGHIIGNHSYSHSYLFPLFTYNKMRKDIEKSQEILEEISKKKIFYFRPPFGVTNPTIAKIVKYFKFTTIGWNIRTYDTVGRKQDKIISHINKKLSPGSIILLHERMPQSEVLLKKILDLIKEKGYSVVSIDSMI